MKKFKIYAGMGGSFGGASYHCTIEAKDEGEALKYAYQLAEEEYQSYEGYHGIMSWEDCEEDLRESGMLEDLTENEYEDVITEHYINEIESWVEFYVKETTGEDEEEEE